MKILVGTPVYDFQLTVPYHMAMLKLSQTFAAERPDVTLVHSLVEGSLLSQSRNALASRVLEDDSFSHLLFVDADMGFRPSLIQKLIGAGKPIVGAVYPKRRQVTQRLIDAVRSSESDSVAQHLATEFSGETELIADENGRLMVRDGFVRQRRLGTGVMLIERSALARLAEAYPTLLAQANRDYQGLGVKTQVFQVFESVQEANGVFLSEDYSFSKRWTDIGGELWACLDETIEHVGRQEFRGTFLRKLQSATLSAKAQRGLSG